MTEKVAVPIPRRRDVPVEDGSAEMEGNDGYYPVP
jgi:hypothetical protein